MKDTSEKPILLVDDIPTKNTLGAAIVVASLASTFVLEPQRLYAPNPLFRRVFLQRTISPEEQRRKDEASLEAIEKAKLKRERKANKRGIYNLPE